LLRLNKMAQLWPESMERRLIYGRDVPDYRATTILLQEVPLVQLVFGDYVLDRERRELSRGSEQIALEPQVLDVLIHLVQNAIGW
jgi:DNA-binding response OmpR family regulator